MPPTGHEEHPAVDEKVAFAVVAIAASAGGLNALTQVLSKLPGRFSAPIVVVQHLHPHARSYLASILSQRSALTVKQAEAGDRLHAGRVYVAPPNRHLWVNSDGVLSLPDSPPVNFSRPAADCLFESVACSFQQRAIGVVLTGTGRDGAHGIEMIKQSGGVTIAQDQNTSEFFGMPSAAIQTQAVDRILPLNSIAPALVELVMGE